MKDRHQLIHQIQNLLKEKRCLSTDECCSSTIVRAHTISKANFLNTITEGDHVIEWKVNYWPKEGEAITNVRTVGINEASTFNGFCSVHDSGYFKSIDKEEFKPTKQQLYEQSFRAFSRELYFKEAQAKLYKKASRIKKSCTQEEAVHDQLLILGSTTGLRDAILHFTKLDQIRVSGDLSSFKAVVFKLKCPPFMAAAGAFTPEYNLNGKKLQDLDDLDKVSAQMHYSILPVPDGQYVILSYLKDDASVCDRFLHSIAQHKKLPNVLISLAFHCIENLQLKISFWESLRKNAQILLSEAFNKDKNFELPSDFRYMRVIDIFPFQITFEFFSKF